MKRINLKENHINDKSTDFLGDYLQSLGIKKEDVSCFITCPRPTDLDNPHDLSHLDEAVEAAYRILSQPKPVSVYVQPDADTDGFTSAAVLINFLTKAFSNVSISWKLHPGKEHGIIPQYITDEELVFIPDAGSNDYRQQEELVHRNKTVIVLDHHEVENYRDTGAIVVNNQSSPRFSNKSMSGVGIVYMFIKAMCDKHKNIKVDYTQYLDLTAVGIIADAMNMTTLGNNYIAYHGLNNIHNKFLKELINRETRGIKNPASLTKIDVAFYLAPAINGLIRFGKEEEKEFVFKAMFTESCLDVFESDYRGTHRVENLWNKAARLAVNAKSRQDESVKKSFEWLCSIIREKGWDKHNIIVAPLDEDDAAKVNPNLTGLIAMKLVKEFNKPTLVLRKTSMPNDNSCIVYGGSGRNGSFFGLPSLLDFLNSSGYVKYAAGHANAFGVFITPENIAALRQYADENLKANAFDDTYIDVDYWFKDNTINPRMLWAFADISYLYGNGIPQPKFAFSFNYCESDYRIMGKGMDSVKISKCGVDFVVFKNPRLIHSLGMNKGGSITIVGRPEINEWNGRRSLQIQVDEIETSRDKQETKSAVVEVTEPTDFNDWGGLL